jgi:adenylate cyclase
MRVDPRGSDWYRLDVGWAYAAMGRFAEAIPELKRYNSKGPRNFGTHLTLAICYAETGQKEQARAEAAEVRRLNPKFSLNMMHPGPQDHSFPRVLAELREAGLS